MPTWFAKTIFYLILIGLLITGVIVGLSYLQIHSDMASQPTTGPVPTVNATALTQYTPTPGFSVPQNATAVYLAKPTPYVEWTPYDAQLFANSLRKAAIASTKNLTIASQISAPGAGWVCAQIHSQVFIWDIKGSNYCRINLTWTDWQTVFNPEDMIIKVEEGDHVRIPAKDENGNDYIKEMALAKVTIEIPEFGLNSPGVRFDQRYDFYQDVGKGWNLVIDIKNLLTNVDLRQQVNQLTADAPNLALADSLAPLQSDGTRSSVYTDQLYSAFVTSLTQPGSQHVYNTLLDTAKLVAGFRCPEVTTPSPNSSKCIDHNFAGLQSLTVIVPSKPNTPCDYVYYEDEASRPASGLSRVLPARYCTYTWQVTGITTQAKTNVATQIDLSNLTDDLKNSLVRKLFQVP